MATSKGKRDTRKNKQIEWERNGLRCAIFAPKPKVVFKGYYKGEWHNDMREGEGKELNRYGCMYDGDWLYGRKHGYGVLRKLSKDGSLRQMYRGSWKNGKKHGSGSRNYDDGSYYTGMFVKNKRHGYGRIWYCDGSYYQGSWQNDRYHGEGVLTQVNGNVYTGQFLDGKKAGAGLFYHMNTGQLQRGIWNNGACISSTMQDIDWRQSAPKSTQYPIPKIGLITQCGITDQCV